MRARHPTPRDCDLAKLRALPRMPPTTAARPIAQTVYEALLSFSSGSAGELSGHRAQHILDASIPCYRHEVLRPPQDVVALLSASQAPPPIRLWMASKLRPVTEGEAHSAAQTSTS